MALPTILTILLGTTAIQILKLYLQLSRHLAEAKASGIPYVVVPFFHPNHVYRLFSIIILPILHSLPKGWTEPWLDLIVDWSWKARYKQFQKIGADTFLTVAPERITLSTADAKVINQITDRRNDFPKPVGLYGKLRIYGDNVVVTEGDKWRHHRKLTSPPFSEKNNHLVWQESLTQTQAMVAAWLGSESRESPTLSTIADDARRLSLYVLSKAGFGVPMTWPQIDKAGRSKGLEHGHSMSYTQALVTLLHSVTWVLACPHLILKYLPFEVTERAYTSFVEWGDYMSEMFDKKKSEVLTGCSSDQPDLMISMIKGANVTSDPSTQTLTDSEIMGNAFVIFFAGHETTANSIHFSLVYLALHTASQRHLQQDLDSIFQGAPPESWDYSRVIHCLLNSMAGAVLNEELRILAPVNTIPKCTLPNNPQPLTIGGKKCLVPGNTLVQLVTPAVHRNPHVWPTCPSKETDRSTLPSSQPQNDLEDFKPERWILDTEAKRAAAMEIFKSAATDGDADKAAALGVQLHHDTGAGLYKPPRGAFIPFSAGHRSCLGQRFAQVELMAVLSVIFSQYSVELAVDEWATDEELQKMDGRQNREIWDKARAKVKSQLRDDMGSIITMQLRKGHIPLRLVKRGSERFNF